MKDVTKSDYNKSVIIENGYHGIITFFQNKGEMSEFPSNIYNDVAEDFESYRDKLENLYDGEPDLNDKGRKTVLVHFEEGLELMRDAKAGSIQLYPIHRAIRILNS